MLAGLSIIWYHTSIDKSHDNRRWIALNSKDMIEIFLFVNPLDKNSLEIARSVFHFPDTRHEKVSVRFVTIKANDDSYPNAPHKGKSLDFNPSFIPCLAFQAASMQGKKRGIQFFIKLQSLLFEEGYELNEETILEAAQAGQIDLQMFKEDLYSDLAKKSYQRDKHLAKEMEVNKVPTCIIYYHTDHMNKARMELMINEYTLHYACNTCSRASKLTNALLPLNPIWPNHI